MLTRPTEAVVRGLLLLQHPNFDALRAWLEESRQQTVEKVAEGEPGHVLSRLQGEAKQLKDLLAHIKDAQNIAEKMNQK